MTDLFKHPKYIPDKLCHLAEEQALLCFRQGYESAQRSFPSNVSLAILVAHSALETGRWKDGFHCWNFGNVRCTGNNPDKLKDGEYFTMYKCSEVIKNKEIFYEPPHPNSVFRGFKTASDGIVHHLIFLRDKYPGAWKQMLIGDPVAYSHALRVSGYYTAGEERYTKSLVSMSSEFLKKIASIGQDFLDVTHPDLPSIKPPPIEPIQIPEPIPEKVLAKEPEKVVASTPTTTVPKSDATAISIIVGVILAIIAAVFSVL